MSRSASVRVSIALTALLLAGSLAVGVAAAAPRTTMVACAPGYPGTTEQAQPSMDDFAAAVQQAVGWEQRELAAVYHAALDPGLQRLAQDDAALALVPLPFYLEYREKLALTPQLLVEQEIGLSEAWSLVLPATATGEAAALSGWQLAGAPVYSERFVRRVALDGWGPLPTDVEFHFTARVLSYLRKAARGESVAVLLDGAQAAALDRLPFAGELAVVATSKPVPTSLLCSVGDRLPSADIAALNAALLHLHDTDAGADLLTALRLVRFHPLPAAGLAELESAFGGAAD